MNPKCDDCGREMVYHHCELMGEGINKMREIHYTCPVCEVD